MSSPAINDAERTERFRQELERHKSMTSASLDRIHGHLSGLSGRWKDEQFNRFSKVLGNTTDRLRKFLDHTGRQISHLEQVVQYAREVARTTMP